MRAPTAIAFLLLCCGSAEAQDSAVFQAKSDIVVVPVTVTDRSGRFVRGLTADQFELSDAGSRRTIAQFSARRVPVSLGILLDISGSMTESPGARAADYARWADTRRALEVLLSRMGTDDEVLFAVFNDQVLAAPWTQDYGEILRLFDSLRPSGGTALLQAVKQIVPTFARARHQRRVLLLISDGNDTQALAAGVVAPPLPHDENPHTQPLDDVTNQSERARRELVIQGSRSAVRGSGALMYAVGVGTRKGVPVDMDLLDTLTRDSGGYAVPLRDPAEISAAVARICDDLQSQYLLAFEPGRADGQFHAITVRTKERSLRIRARSGYVAPSSNR